MDNAEALVNLLNDLHDFKRSNPHTPTYDEPGRHTYCHILYFPEGKQIERLGALPHKFEVRGFSMNSDSIDISAVNWSVGAGSCTLVISEDNIHQVKILEKDQVLQVLYG